MDASMHSRCLSGRRDFLKAGMGLLGISLGTAALPGGPHRHEGNTSRRLALACFRCEATPPLGHPLCGGWIQPVRGVDDPLRALGVILLGPAAPVVLLAVDWCAVCNDAHATWCKALADPVQTPPDRVALHSIPFCTARPPTSSWWISWPPVARPGRPDRLSKIGRKVVHREFWWTLAAHRSVARPERKRRACRPLQVYHALPYCQGMPPQISSARFH